MHILKVKIKIFEFRTSYKYGQWAKTIDVGYILLNRRSRGAITLSIRRSRADMCGGGGGGGGGGVCIFLMAKDFD